jgi:MFS family permease
MYVTSFTSSETRAVSMLATLYIVRMLGLFMVLPLIAIYSADMTGATTFLLGLAVGAYGLTQATLQIPMGWLSDRIDRRWVIVFGLCLLLAGSLVAAYSTSIWGVIAGRFLQGSGAIASATMALVADYTRVEQRAKASAVIGGSIAIAFGLALVLGPTFANFGGLQAVFAITALLALAGILVVGLLPKPDRQAAKARDEAAGFHGSRLVEVLSIKSLNTMYVSIFFLHFLLMAVFVVVPSGLEAEAGIARERHALAYLGALVLSVPGIYLLVQGRRYLSAPTRTLLLCLFVLLSGLVSMSLGGFVGTLLGTVAVLHGLYGIGSDAALVGFHLRARRFTRHRHGCFCILAIHRCLFWRYARRRAAGSIWCDWCLAGYVGTDVGVGDGARGVAFGVTRQR